MLSYDLWSGRYGRDATIVGRTITVNDRASTVIGVMPKGWRFPFDAELWLLINPWVTGFRERPTVRNFQCIGRLATTLGSAQSELASVQNGLSREFPDSETNVTFSLTSFHERYRSPEFVRLSFALLAAGVVLLAIGALNVTNILLSAPWGENKNLVFDSRSVRQPLTLPGTC